MTATTVKVMLGYSLSTYKNHTWNWHVLDWPSLGSSTANVFIKLGSHKNWCEKV